MAFTTNPNVRLTCTITRASPTLHSTDTFQLASEAIRCFTRFVNTPALLRGNTLELDDNRYSTNAALWQCKGGLYSVHSQLELPQEAMGSPLVKQVCASEANIILFTECGHYSQEDWCDFFKRHPKVEIMKFAQPKHVEDVLHFLAGAVPDAKASGSLAIPKLRKISFQQTSFDETSTSAIFDVLRTALISRHLQGAPITILEFLRCFRLNPSKLAEWKKRIPGVTQVIERDEDDGADGEL